MPLEIPVGEYVQHGLICPLGLEIVCLVLGEAAVVEQPELAPGGGIDHGIGLAAIVESGPVAEPHQPGAVAVEFPASGDAVEGRVALDIGCAVHRGYVPGGGVVKVDPACTASRGLLRAERDASGVLRAVTLDGILHYVVVSGHVGSLDGTRPPGGGHCHQPCGVEAVGDVAQVGYNRGSALIPLHAPLLVADAPEYYRGVVEVAVNHLLELPGVIAVYAEQAVLLDHDEAERVTSRQHLGSGGVV